MAADARENPFRFGGHYYDSAAKSYDMRARAYLPEIGPFLGEDRFEDPQGDQGLEVDSLTQDRYLFAGGNPVDNIEDDDLARFDDRQLRYLYAQVAAEERRLRIAATTGPDWAGVVFGDSPLEVAINIIPLGRGANLGRRLGTGVFRAIRGSDNANEAAKDVPTRVARVLEDRVGRSAETLGAPDEADVFVTSADDVAGLSAKQIAERLSLYDSAGKLRSGAVLGV